MPRVTRRGFLRALGWSAAGITVLAGAGYHWFPVLPPRVAPSEDDAGAWISLRPDGRFAIHSPRVEMGQGIAVGLRQIAAEELGVGLAQVDLAQPDTALVPLCSATVGSDSMRHYGPLFAQAAAALAVAIRREAARRLGVDASAVTLSEAGAAAGGGRALSLAALGGTEPAIVVAAEDVAGAAPVSFAPDRPRRVVGASAPTDGVRAIVTGDAALYADDIRLPGMLFGAVVRSDGIEGRVAEVDDSACRDLPGYAGLVRGDGLAGVLAQRRGALAEALRRLEVRDVFDDALAGADLAAALDVDAGLKGGTLEHVLAERGDPGAGDFDVDLRLDVPFAAHASIEPRTAVARFDTEGRLEVWSGTQDAFFVRNVLADALGLAQGDVVVHGMRIGGGFGARTLVAAELDAARLAKLSGRPVKVQWSRRDEFRAGFHRPPSSHRIRASADAKGRITRWWHAFRAGHIIFTSAGMGPTLQFATSFVADPGTARGALPPYASAAMRVEFEDVRLPVMTGPWRGLGAAGNCWAIETAIDALARRHGRDPLAFRLANIGAGHERLGAVLRRAAGMAGWPGRTETPDRALGIAGGVYKDMAYAAAVAEVVFSGGRPRVTRIWCAHDCGLVVNPDQVRAQVEGNLIWGIGMALKEELEIEDGRILARDFFDYDLLRYSEAPRIEVSLVEGAAEPAGAGESAIVCGAAAVTNAITRATGDATATLPWRAA